MALVNVTRKAVSTQGYQLTSQSDMFAALDYLKTRGYSGNVATYKNGSGAAAWQLTIQADSGTTLPQTGFINDWVVIENDSIATIYPPAKAAALYQTT